MTTTPIANLGTALASAAACAALANAPIVESYAGRAGCACGCRGTYSDAPATIKRRLSDVRRIGEAGAGVLWISDDIRDGWPMYFALDYETDAGAERTITMYVRK